MKISLDPSRWNFLYSKNAPRISSEGAGFKFNFPAKKGQVDYLQTKQTNPISGTFKISGKIDVAGEFWAADGDQPPCHFSLLVRRGNELYELDNRYWSVKTPLVAGPFSLAVPLKIDYWSNVYAQRNETLFNRLLKNPSAIGITFGGASFAGHGVGMISGSATFHVSSIEIG